ncbi:unnamed protein product, partial [Amoebophrya sp. A25]
LQHQLEYEGQVGQGEGQSRTRTQLLPRHQENNDITPLSMSPPSIIVHDVQDLL